MKIKIGVGVLILLIFLIFAGADVTSLLRAASAALFHELGHLLSAIMLKKRITAVTLEPLGARISIGGGVSYMQELLIALSGPLASFLLFFALRRGDTADYSLFLGLINLLPVSTLDGGRVIDCAVSYCFGPSAGQRALKVCGKVCIFALWLISVYLLLRYDGGFGLFAYSFIFAAIVMRN